MHRTPHSLGFTRSLGFSRLEILAIATLLIVVTAVLIPSSWIAFGSARRQEWTENRNEINLAVARWHLNKGVWPANDLSDIGASKSYFPRGLPRNPYNGEAYVLDGQTHRVK